MRFLRAVLAGLIYGTVLMGGLGCAFAAAAALGGRDNVDLDVLAHFAPFWLAGGVLTLIVALTADRGLKVLLSVIGGVATVASLMLVFPEFIRPASPSAGADAARKLKIIQFNTWGRNDDIQATARWIVAQQPDIVTIQEAKPAMRDALVRQGGYHVTCSRCSVMIFSREKPVSRDVEHKDVPRPKPPMAAATFGRGASRYTVLTTHRTWPTTRGLQQAQGLQLIKVISRYPQPRLIVTGDFNSTPWSFTRRREDEMIGIERRTRALFSWPAGEFTRFRINAPVPFLPIDHVYAGPAWRTVSVERGPKLGSDHYPVIVVLALDPTAGADQSSRIARRAAPSSPSSLARSPS